MVRPSDDELRVEAERILADKKKRVKHVILYWITVYGIVDRTSKRWWKRVKTKCH